MILVFWNKMESGLVSDVGVNLLELGTGTFAPAKFGNGWNNNTNNQRVYIPSGSENTVFTSAVRAAGCVTFYFKALVNYDQVLGDSSFADFMGSQEDGFRFVNGDWQFFIRRYSYGVATVSLRGNWKIGIAWKTGGVIHDVLAPSVDPGAIGLYSAGDILKITVAWDELKRIEGQYSYVFYINDTKIQDSTDDCNWSPSTTLTRPPFTIGESVYPYSTNTSVPGYIDNIQVYELENNPSIDEEISAIVNSDIEGPAVIGPVTALSKPKMRINAA